MDDKELEQLEQQEAQEQKETEAANKTAHVAGKAAATYFGGKAGAEAGAPGFQPRQDSARSKRAGIQHLKRSQGRCR